MIDRRTFIGTLAGGLLAPSLAAFAQQSNPKTAKALGLTIPQSMLMRGVEMIS